MVTIIMKRSIRVTTKKKRGRPTTTGKGIQVGERWHPPELKAIDQWIAAQGEEMTRAHAIRRLVEMSLNRSKPVGRPPAKSAERAKQLAAKAIEGLVDPTAPAEEKAFRKTRLLEGPPPFRDVRVDREKKS